MPTTVYPCDIPLEQVSFLDGGTGAKLASHYIQNPFEIIPLDKDLQHRKGHVLQVSFPRPSGSSSDDEYLIFSSLSNGLVSTALRAYNSHHHLVLRPDDIWIAILTQFNYFVNSKPNSETFGTLFFGPDAMSSQSPKKRLEVATQGGLASMDAGKLAIQMTIQIQTHITDKNLCDWILPNFSTTTPNDTVIASIAMMSTFKDFFDYSLHLWCGLPAVTLLGDQSDWEKIMIKIEKLVEFGGETTRWRELLFKVLEGFINTFKSPKSLETKSFWTKIAHMNSNGSGPSFLSGWLTAFCFFDHNDTKDIPPAYAEAPILLNDNGTEITTVMVAGLVGTRVVGEKQDTVQPQPAWWIAQDDDAAEHAEFKKGAIVT